MTRQQHPRSPSYRLHKATGQAVVTLNGRDLYLGKHGTPASRIACDRLIAEWLTKGRQLPRAMRSDDLTINELVLAYWRHVQAYYVKNGEPTWEQDCVRSAQWNGWHRVATDAGTQGKRGLRTTSK